MRQRALIVVLVVMLSGFCASCASKPQAQPSIAPSVQSPESEPTMTPMATTTVQPIRRTAHPWRVGDFQNGIQLYWHMKGPWLKQVRRANQQLDYVASLGANSIGITFSIYTDGATPTHVYAGTRTPSLRALAMLVDAAQQRGLRVMLRPTIYEANIVAENPQAWRGSIQPVSIDRWFASYAHVLLPYVHLAAQHNVQEFVAGSELNSLQSYPQWNDLQRQIKRTGFQGQVSYAFNWDAIAQMPFRYVGIDAYPALSLGDQASVKQLVKAIRATWQHGFGVPPNRVTLQEVGIPSLSGMYAHPWHASNKAGEKPNFAVQAKWFAAMYAVARQSHMRGIYYWSLDSNMDIAQANPHTDYVGSFVGKPAETVIREHFNH